MPTKRYNAEQIMTLLRQVEVWSSDAARCPTFLPTLDHPQLARSDGQFFESTVAI
jgi:hypothetical protein